MFHNSAEGILVYGTDTVRRNFIYSNSVGIRAQAYADTIENNLVYGNTNHGIWIYGSYDPVWRS